MNIFLLVFVTCTHPPTPSLLKQGEGDWLMYFIDYYITTLLILLVTSLVFSNASFYIAPFLASAGKGENPERSEG
jgi:hypothetical protein